VAEIGGAICWSLIAFSFAFFGKQHLLNLTNGVVSLGFDLLFKLGDVICRNPILSPILVRALRHAALHNLEPERGLRVSQSDQVIQ
jgi:hypothetical protein